MKRVRFDEKLTVHIMTDWLQALQEGRISTWVLKARNHYLFRKRSTALKIECCLKPKHREKMRFCRFV